MMKTMAPARVVGEREDILSMGNGRGHSASDYGR